MEWYTLGSSHESASGPGVVSEVEPPVPFSNTAVKRFSADDTVRAVLRENRSMPGPLMTHPMCLQAQFRYSLGEWRLSRDGAVAARRAHNPKVVGSNPTPATKEGSCEGADPLFVFVT